MTRQEMRDRCQAVVVHYATCLAAWRHEMWKPEGFRDLAKERALCDAETRLNRMLDYVCRVDL